jgi:hypothetical protein
MSHITFPTKKISLSWFHKQWTIFFKFHLLSPPYVWSLFNRLPNIKIVFVFHMLSKKREKVFQQFEPTLCKTIGRLGNKYA